MGFLYLAAASPDDPGHVFRLAAAPSETMPPPIPFTATPGAGRRFPVRDGSDRPPRARSAYRAGTCSSGIGVAAKRRLSGMASQRAQAAARDTRALSVAMPVLPYIWRYSFDTSRNASR